MGWQSNTTGLTKPHFKPQLQWKKNDNGCVQFPFGVWRSFHPSLATHTPHPPADALLKCSGNSFGVVSHFTLKLHRETWWKPVTMISAFYRRPAYTMVWLAVCLWVDPSENRAWDANKTGRISLKHSCMPLPVVKLCTHATEFRCKVAYMYTWVWLLKAAFLKAFQGFISCL